MSGGRQPSGRERAYRDVVRGFSLAFIVIGIVVLIVTLVNGGGPASVGFFMGLAFIAVGAGRLWLGARMER